MKTTIAASQNIKTSFKKGDKAEQVCGQILTNHGYQVDFVGKIEDYRKKDIDFVCSHQENETITVEVKSDDRGYKTGNFSFESISNCTLNTPGWTLYTQSDFLMIQHSNLIYFLDGPATVKWFTKHYCRFKKIYNHTTTKNGEPAYYSEFRLVSKKIYDKEVGILYIFDLDGNILMSPAS